MSLAQIPVAATLKEIHLLTKPRRLWRGQVRLAAIGAAQAEAQAPIRVATTMQAKRLVSAHPLVDPKDHKDLKDKPGNDAVMTVARAATDLRAQASRIR